MVKFNVATIHTITRKSIDHVEAGEAAEEGDWEVKSERNERSLVDLLVRGEEARGRDAARIRPQVPKQVACPLASDLSDAGFARLFFTRPVFNGRD